MKNLKFFWLGAICTMVSASALAIDLYIDGTSGDDTWDGTAAEQEAGTKHGPLKTISRFKTLYNSTDNVILHIAGGVYPGGTQPFTYRGSGKPWLNAVIIGSDDPDNPTVFDGEDQNWCLSLNNAMVHARFDHLVFRNGRCASSGSGIYCSQNCDNLSFSNCTFESCCITNKTTTGSQYGGGALTFGQGRAPEFYRCQFYGCSSEGQGGAVNLSGMTTDVHFVECTFATNRSLYGTGGALFVGFPSNEYTQVGICLDGCTFTSNFAMSGGALGGPIQKAFNSRFVGNVASVDGGAWYLDGYSDKIALGAFILTNTFEQCVFTGNCATNRGGALGWNYEKRFAFRDCIFSNNVSVYGASVWYGSLLKDFVLDGCRITGNRGIGMLAAATVAPSPRSPFGVRFNELTFDNNDAGNASLLTLVSSQSGLALAATNCVFRRNVGKWVIDTGITGCTNALANLVFEANTNCVDAGVFNVEWRGMAGTRMSNCTFVDNVAETSPYAIFQNSSKTASQFDNIAVFGNHGPNGETGIEVNSGFFKVSSHCFYSTGTADVPKNRDNVTGTSPRFYAGTCVPRPSSPLRGKGSVAEWMAGAVDPNGRSRLNADGTVDIGAYSFELRDGMMLYIY